MTLRKQAISGVKWTTVATATLAICTLLKISILTRFLAKADFGLMALIMFVMGFMDLFMDMGLTSAILHKQKITRKEYASLYWLNFGFSILIFLIILLLSPLISAFYDQPSLKDLIPLMAFGIILSGIGRQFKTILQKEIKFKIIAIVEICAAVLSLFVAIILAIKNYGVYSLVFAALVQYFTSNMLFFILGVNKQKLLFHFSYSESKPFLKIGIYQVGGQIINYFNRDLDVLIIGKFFGSELLGGYSLAKQLVYRPAQILNPILTKVASPVLAKMQGDKNLLKKNYLKLITLVTSVNVPIYIGIILFAPILVGILYGDGYDSIVILVRILSVYMIFRAVGNPIGSLVVATGRTDLEFKWNLFTFIIIPIAVFIGALFSITHVTIAITIAMALLLIPSWYFLVYKLTGANLKEYLRSFVPRITINEIKRLFK